MIVKYGAGMQKADTLLNAKWLITVDPNNRILHDHSLVIRDTRIADILPTVLAREKYQATNCELNQHIVAPGLINTHMHMGMNLLKGYADDLPLMEWLEKYIWPAEAQWVDEEFVADGARLAIAESLLGGTTCVNDMYFFADVTADVAIRSGIRACIGLIVLDFPTIWASNAEEYLKKALVLADELKDNPLVSVAFAPHAPYTVSREPLERIQILSSELDLPIHIHVHETVGEVEQFVAQHGIRPIQRLEEVGLLNPSLLAVHMTQLTQAEITKIAAANVNVAHCPESNMKLASGTCPVSELLKAGVNVCLGTDSVASNNDLDMFGEMRTAALLAKHSTADASALNAERTLRMATINGAQALGLADTTGSLEIGKAADIIAVDTSALNMAPIYEPISHLVYAASRNCVDHVWVNGQQVVKNKTLTTMDSNSIRERTQHWLHKIHGAEKSI